MDRSLVREEVVKRAVVDNWRMRGGVDEGEEERWYRRYIRAEEGDSARKKV